MVKACGKEKCFRSTFIDGVTITYGTGRLSDCGQWEFPCKTCEVHERIYARDHGSGVKTATIEEILDERPKPT